MFLKNYFKENRNTWLMVVLGVVVGLLAMWLALKALRPVVRSVCTYVLESDEDKGGNRQGRLVSVEATTVKMGTMSKRIATVGKLRANASVTIRSEMNGRIKELSFTEGGSVKEGQSIIKFEDSDAQAEVKTAEAELMLRKADFERSLKLHDQKIGSAKDLDKARAELGIADGRLDSARSKLDKTVIHAPFSGTIGLIDVSVGAYVQAAQDLVTIVDSTPIKVEFKVPEKNIHDIGVGQTVEVRIDAFKDQIFRGIVDAVDAQVQSESHSISIKAAISNEDGLLRPGLFANISLIIGEKGETILIDESAVDREGEIEFVWIIEKGKAGRRRILTGTREDGKIEIVAGLKPEQIVVTAGQLKLGDGVRVKITNMPEIEAKEDSPKKEGEEPVANPEGKAPEPKAEEIKVEEQKVEEPKAAEKPAPEIKTETPAVVVEPNPAALPEPKAPEKPAEAEKKEEVSNAAKPEASPVVQAEAPSTHEPKAEEKPGTQN